MKVIKIALIQRVITPYRLPTYQRISKIGGYNLVAYHGPNFKGTKVENASNLSAINAQKLWSFAIKMNSKNGVIAMPFSPGLFFKLLIQNPDVIICEGASNIINTSIAYLYKFIFRKKIIWWSLGKVPNRSKSLFRKILDRWIFMLERNASAIIAYNNHAKEYFISDAKVNPNKIFVALNTIDTEKRLVEISKLDRDKIYDDAHKTADFIILYVGAIFKGKKLDILLEAFKNLELKNTANKKIKLKIVGKGEAKHELEVIAKKMEIQNVEFVGEVLEGVNKYFLEADVFVLPGLGGLAIPDAMVHGLPVIASSADGSEYDFITAENGVIIPDINSEKLFSVLNDWLNNPTLVASMKLNAYNTISTKYNFDRFIQEIQKAILYTQSSYDLKQTKI